MLTEMMRKTEEHLPHKIGYSTSYPGSYKLLKQEKRCCSQVFIQKKWEVSV